MAGKYHQYNEDELGQTLGDGEGQRNLVCCSSWGSKELDTTCDCEQLIVDGRSPSLKGQADQLEGKLLVTGWLQLPSIFSEETSY